MSKIILVIIVLVGACLTSCEDYTNKRKNIVCLVDYSNSINQKTLKDYAEGIRMILIGMGPEDKLVVYPIDQGSMTDRVTLVYEDFKNANEYSGKTFKLNIPDSISPPFKKKGEDIFRAQERQPKRVAGYLSIISPLIEHRLDSLKHARRQYGYKSDVFSAIAEIESDLVKTQKNPWIPAGMSGEEIYNYLIIFSDMVQDSDLVSFDTNKPLERESFPKILDNLKAERMIPNLQQARVVIYDNFSQSQAAKAMNKRRIKEFWEYYFADSTLNIAQGGFVYQNNSKPDFLVQLLADDSYWK